MPSSWLLPSLGAAAFVVFALRVVLRADAPMKSAWIAPAALSLGFALWTVHAALAEGLFGFWAEHIRNAWGHQIWFDLLLALGIGWLAIAPQARALGMRLVPWLLLVICTGSIGLLALLARVLCLQQHAGAINAPAAPSDRWPARPGETPSAPR
jgi:hypothetical protein